MELNCRRCYNVWPHRQEMKNAEFNYNLRSAMDDAEEIPLLAPPMNIFVLPTMCGYWTSQLLLFRTSENTDSRIRAGGGGGENFRPPASRSVHPRGEAESRGRGSSGGSSSSSETRRRRFTDPVTSFAARRFGAPGDVADCIECHRTLTVGHFTRNFRRGEVETRCKPPPFGFSI